MEIQERYFASQPGKPEARDGAKPIAGIEGRQPDQKSA